VNTIGLLSVAAIAAFFLFLRYLEYSINRRQQKRLAQLASLSCPRCGASFGVEVAKAACDEGEQRMAETMTDAKTRGVRLRVVMHWPVTCPRCGTNYMFLPDEVQLTWKGGYKL
jgi:ribosomal protein S27AE